MKAQQRFTRRLVRGLLSAAALIAGLASISGGGPAGDANALLSAGRDFTITAVLSAPLYPGVPRSLHLTAHNPLSVPITVIALSTQLGTPVPAGCPGSNLDLSKSNWTGSLPVPAHGTGAVSVPITLVSTATDSCKLVTFNLVFSGTATYTRFKTDTDLVSAPNPSLLHHAVTLTAIVSSSRTASDSLHGTVTFFDGSTRLATVPLNSTTHRATYTTSTLSIGTHRLHAVYSGDASFAGSASLVVTQRVRRDAWTCIPAGGNTTPGGQDGCNADG